jgi:hypothetical protein
MADPKWSPSKDVTTPLEHPISRQRELEEGRPKSLRTLRILFPFRVRP